MQLLLDTCAAIWLVEAMPMTGTATEAIYASVEAETPVLVSPITAWERALLIAKGRLASPLPPKVWFGRLLALEGVGLAGLSADILTDASFLPGSIHNDSADRILIATARGLDLTIVTRDRAILAYGKAGHVRVLPC